MAVWLPVQCFGVLLPGSGESGFHASGFHPSEAKGRNLKAPGPKSP